MPRTLATGGAVAALLIVLAIQVWSPPGSEGSGARARPGLAPVRPFVFEPNAGRTDGRVDFLARGKGYGIWLAGRESVIAVGTGRRRATVRTRFTGARPVAATGEQRAAMVVNSYVGARSRWRTGLHTYGAVRYRGLYPGIDLVYHGHAGRLEYDFELSPGADPGRIGMALSGARDVRVTATGDLVLATAAGALVQKRPLAFQRTAAGRRPVSVAYRVHGHRIGLRLGAYDRTKPLAVDPEFRYATYAGGTGEDAGFGIAVDNAGAAYVTGGTASTDFPPSPTAGTGHDQAFVLKLDDSGTSRPYLTYLGGNGDTVGVGIALDGHDPVVAGQTDATNLAVTGNALQGNAAGTDAFVAKLGDSGALAFSTYLGGSGFDTARAVAVDEDGNAVVAGGTQSSDFPHTAGVVQTANDGSDDAFVASIDPTAGTLNWSTYLGGTSADDATGVALAADGTVYVGGLTQSGDFEVDDAMDYPLQGSVDAFVTALSSDGTSRVWSRFVGGDGTEIGHGIAVDPSTGDVALVGESSSSDFGGPTSGGSDGFVAVFDDSGDPLWNRRIGVSSGSDEALAVTFDGYSRVYVAGHVSNAQSFTQANGLPDSASGSEPFVAKLDWPNDVTAVVYSSTFGGAVGQATGIAVGPDLSAYVTGYTDSNGFPVVPASGAQPDPNPTGNDAFVVKIAAKPMTVARVDAAPAVQNPTQTFTFSSAESGGVGYECKVDNQAPVACQSPRNATVVSDGMHTFGVRSLDHAGCNPECPQTTGYTTVTWLLDRAPPAAFSLSAPADGASGVGLRPTFVWDRTTDATSGVASYSVLVDGAEVASVDPASCGPSTCSAVAGSDLAVGPHGWKVVAVDAAGNPRSVGDHTFTVVVPPTAHLTVSPNPALVGASVTFDGSGSADSVRTLARFEWDFDGDGTVDSDTGANATTTHSYGSAGTFNATLRVTDTQGNSATTTVPVRISLQTLPKQFGVSINGGAQYTRTPNVTVTAVYPNGTSGLLLSNDGGFFAPTQLQPAREVKWKLDSSGPERLPKIVYVRFLNGPIVSETHTDDIILDETPPTVQQAALVPTGSAAGAVANAAKAKAKRWKLKLKASDSNSGVASVQITANKRKPGKLLRYKKKLTVSSATRPRFARARDRAGNYSRWRKVR